MQDDESPRDVVADALDAWTPLPPPADFADRVLAAQGELPVATPWRRRSRIAALVMAAAVAAAAVLVLRTPNRAAAGAVLAAQRTTAVLGDRGIAVAEPASDLVWRIDDRGAAEITQRSGNVFYRVERGGPFVVHTPAGDVRVTGTCFRIEVEPMTPNHKLLIAGLAGAAAASLVLVTVYEGHVVAQTRSAKTELAAGSHAALGGPDGATLVSGAAFPPSPADDALASREQLLTRTRVQQVQLDQLRARLAVLEKTAPTPGDFGGLDAPEPGRMWHDPSPETLAAWVANCHVRTDEPELTHFTPLTEPDEQRGIAAGELAGYNAAITEVAKRWKDLVRSLYIETTGDTAGAESLSTDAMRREIEEKSPSGEHNLVLQQVARERAGLAAPPTDLSKASVLERLARAHMQLGAQTEAAVAQRLGAERAHAIRGQGWGLRFEASGCPSEK